MRSILNCLLLIIMQLSVKLYSKINSINAKKKKYYSILKAEINPFPFTLDFFAKTMVMVLEHFLPDLGQSFKCDLHFSN